MLRMSRQLGLGSAAPPFDLLGVDGGRWTLDDVAGSPALLVAFICNHCPFVLHILDHFTAFARDYQARGLQVVAISSNDPREFPEDHFEHMRLMSAERDFSFPYLLDESQD